MRRLLGPFGFAAAVFLTLPSHVWACERPRVEGLETTLAIMAKAGRPSYTEGLLICATIVELRRESPTFADLLKVLVASPRLHVFLTASASLLRQHKFIGRTRFSVGPDAISAFVELRMDRTNLGMQRESVAHELAHVAEVACLGTPVDGSTLRLRLDGRDGGRKGTPEAPIETKFAKTIGRVVELEAARHDLGRSRFAALARDHGLNGCPTIARVTPMLAASRPIVPGFPEDDVPRFEQEAAQ